MLLVFLIVTSATLPAFSQQVNVTGTVRDAVSHEPLIGVTISFGNNGTVTGNDGKYNISLPAGDYTAEFSYLG